MLQQQCLLAARNLQVPHPAVVAYHEDTMRLLQRMSASVSGLIGTKESQVYLSNPSGSTAMTPLIKKFVHAREICILQHLSQRRNPCVSYRQVPRKLLDLSKDMAVMKLPPIFWKRNFKKPSKEINECFNSRTLLIVSWPIRQDTYT